MLKFSPSQKQTTHENKPASGDYRDADTFIEAFALLKNDINYRKNLVKKAKFIKIQLEAATPIIANPIELFKQFMLEEVFDSQQSPASLSLHFDYFVAMNGGVSSACEFLIKSDEDSLAEYDSLLRIIKKSLDDGSTLAPYLWCKQLLGAAKHRHASNVQGARARREFLANNADHQDKYDRIIGISTLTTIFNLLHETLSAEELQVSKEIHILYTLDQNSSRLDYGFDSELFAYLRGDKLTPKSKQTSKSDIDQLQNKTMKAVKGLLSECLSSKGQMLAASVLAPDLYLKILTTYDHLPHAQQQDPILAPLTALLEFYKVKDELVQLKAAFDYSEVYDTPNNRGKSLIVDYDKLGTPEALRKELYDQCEMLDRAKLKVLQETVQTPEPNKSKPNTEDKTNAVVADKPPVQAQSTVKAALEEEDETIAQEPSVKDITNYSSSSKRTAAEREDLAQQREMRRRKTVLARMVTMANLGHKKFKADGSEIKSDIKELDKAAIIRQEKLFSELFSLTCKAFSRNNADTIFESLDGVIKDRNSGGSHVSLFLRNINSSQLRLIGATSFHGAESGCAMLESLNLLRNALYRHLSPNAIEYLRDTLGKNFYEPARRDVTSSATVKNKA
jgi:hypothetical protein